MSRPTEPVEPVRVGDRYVRPDGARVTITKVEDHSFVDYSFLLDGDRWMARAALPLPTAWDKVGSGPVPEQEKIYCVKHALREAEPGQIFCPDCVDQFAASWAQYAPDEAADMAAHLIAEQRGHS
jgi:hypothetical protein